MKLLHALPTPPSTPESTTPSAADPSDPDHDAPSFPTSVSNEVFDVIIVGAGPCSLALAARLSEDTPAALFTEEEHQRWTWIKHKQKSAGGGSNKAERSAGHEHGETDVDTCAAAKEGLGTGQILGGKYKTLVLDETSDRFMARWDRLFEAYDISHLRSPMFFHLDPSDRDSLLSFACQTRRYEKECLEISGVVGREQSKHTIKQRRKAHHKHGMTSHNGIDINERDRHDYFLPSTGLFRDHCESIKRRYGLDENRLIRQACVHDIDYGGFRDTRNAADSASCTLNTTSPNEYLFRVKTSNGAFLARTVVLATGPRRVNPSSPPGEHSTTEIGLLSSDCVCHASDIKSFPAPRVQALISQGFESCIVVVGGGLTSAQLADLAIRRGVARVWLFLRGPLKSKPFDVDLAWIGKWKNRAKAAFWNADNDEERIHMIRQARNGGSIPSKYVKVLKQHEANGRLVICPDTTLQHINKACPGEVDLVTKPPVQSLQRAHHVYFATGAASPLTDALADAPEQDMPPCADCKSNVPPLLRTLQSKYPMRWPSGFPALSDDLSWATQTRCTPCTKTCIPLYVTGGLAALRLGPGAPNLEGARLGAERVAWGLEEALHSHSATYDSTRGIVEHSHMFENRYEGL